MANYYATARSNYFAVKDETIVLQWAEFAGLIILEHDHQDKTADGIRRFAITPDDGDDSGWPTTRYDEEAEAEAEAEAEDDVDVPSELAAFLRDGEVAVLIEVGSEKLRYLCGFATTLNSSGETLSMSLEGIYDLAGKLGTNVTCAEY